MKLAFCIFKYFPYGGLQRDMFRAIEIAIARGHEVDVYTMDWEGELPQKVHVNMVDAKGLTNHHRARIFSSNLNRIFNHQAYDRIIGFNKMPGLDIYFTGENCFAQHLKSKYASIVRYFPRYWTFSFLEKKVFEEKSKTEILLISPKEKEIYKKFYHTQEARFHVMFPGIERRLFSSDEALVLRKKTRESHKLSQENIWLLFVASDYAVKGLERVLKAIEILDDAFSEKIVLSVVGQDKAAPYQDFLRQKKIKTRVDFLGASNHIYELMNGADVLVHPAKQELAGKVLLEAIVNHLPVLTTQVCGCAFYIEESRGGVILPEPFLQSLFIQSLKDMFQPGVLQHYREALCDYHINEAVYRSHDYLVDCIETLNTRSMRDFFLDEELIKQLPNGKAACIKAVFSLKGQVYRQVKNRKTISTLIEDKPYFVKMHAGVGWKEILKNFFALKSVVIGAKQEYHAICKMKESNILVPDVCAYAMEGTNPSKMKSFIITRHIEYHADLEKLCETWSAHSPDFLFKRRLIHRVAEIARKMHAAGMNHRDFYLCHFLLNKRDEEDFDLYLIDLHRVQIREKVPLRWRIKDLSGLYFSSMNIGLTKKDKYYFLTQYYELSLKEIFKKHKLQLFWIHLRAKMLYRRHSRKIGLV